MKKDNVILIGFMGAGKTTIGRRLSNQTQRAFLDTDSYIEQFAGMSISKIFSEKGEAVFRSMETEALKRLLCTCEGHVISCGGGLPLREENRRLLKELGTVVYLQVLPKTVEKRLKGDTARPLLQGENIHERICGLLDARRQFYEAAADICICTDGKTREEICAEIIAAGRN